MTHTQKSTIASVSVLTVIALLATSLMLLLNAILPGVPTLTLDDKAKAALAKIMPNSQFEIVSDFDVNAFNKDNGTKNSTVSMVVKASDGVHDGQYAVRVSAQNAVYSGNPTMDYFVGYDGMSAIIGVIEVSVNETAPGDQAYDRDNWRDAFVANGTDPNAPIDPNQIINSIGTGATATVNAYVEGVNLATKAAMLLNKTAPTAPSWQIANEAETQLLRELVDDNTAMFSKGNSALLLDNGIISDSFDASNLINVFVVRTGDNADEVWIVEHVGDSGGYGNVRLMSIFYGQGQSAVLTKTILSGGSGSSAIPIPGLPTIQSILDALKAFGAQNISRDAWFADYNKDDYPFDLPSGATDNQDSPKGLLLSVQNGFLAYDAIDGDKLLEVVSQTSVPKPAWSKVTPVDLVTLRDMLGSRGLSQANDDENTKLRQLVNKEDAKFFKLSIQFLFDYDIIPKTIDVNTLINIFYQADDGKIIIQHFGDSGDRYGKVQLMSIFSGSADSAMLTDTVYDTGSGTDDARGRLDIKTIINTLRPLLSNISRQDWFANYDISGSVFGNVSGATENQHSPQGLLKSVQNGFAIHDVLDYTKLAQVVKEINDSNDKDEWVAHPSMDFAKADIALLRAYGVLNATDSNLEYVFVSMDKDIILQTTKSALYTFENSGRNGPEIITVTQRILLMIEDGKISQIRLGHDARQGHEGDGSDDTSKGNLHRPYVDNLLMQLFAGKTKEQVSDISQEDFDNLVQDKSSKNNALTREDSVDEEQEIAKFEPNVDNIKSTIMQAFDSRASLNVVEEFLIDATQISWSNIGADVLTQLRDFVSKANQDMNEANFNTDMPIDTSNLQFVSADAKMLEKIGAITPPSTPSSNATEADIAAYEKSLDEYRAMRNAIVNVFVVQDGTGRIIIESFYNFYGNDSLLEADKDGNLVPSIPSDNAHNFGRMSLLVMLHTKTLVPYGKQRAITNVAFGSLNNTTGGAPGSSRPQVQDALNKLVGQVLIGMTEIEFDSFFVPGDWKQDGFWTNTGATYAVNGALYATKFAFAIDSALDRGVLISQASKVK